MAELNKIVKLTAAQYAILENGGTVGEYTGLNSNYLYLVEDNTSPVLTVNNVSPDANGNVSLTIPATNVIPAQTTANKVLLSTTTGGTAKWSDWSTTGFLKTSATGVVSVEPKVLTYSSTQEVSVVGTTKPTYTYAQTTIFAPNGLIMGGTAAAAGLVTRGICGSSTPNSTTGACSKDNLFLNYDGANTYLANRQVIIQAGSAGTHYGSNLYQYAAARGDAVKGWVESQATVTATASKFVNRDTSGNANAVAFNLCSAGTSTANATISYDSTNECIKFTF